MPQATIKLQTAPAPVVAKKPIVSAPAKSQENDDMEPKDDLKKEATLPSIDDEETSAVGVPMPLLMAAAALAFVAFAIQLWTFLS
jgi:hypothetical protein